MPNRLKLREIHITLIALLLFWNYTEAQAQEKISLISALDSLEQRFEVRFSYSEAEIENIDVIFEVQNDLKANLQNLEVQIPFTFNQLNERYITVVGTETARLCGQIIASDTGMPLEGASIEQAGAEIVISNINGFFNIPESLIGQMITIRFLGYEHLRIPVSELTSGCEIILLNRNVSVLDPIVIRKYFIEGVEKNADGSFSLETSNSGLLPGLVEKDVLLSTQALPGIQSVNETISNINVRGGTHDENLILWNDIKAYQSGHFFGLITVFNPNITESVDIYKNGTPSYYGESVSSVIAMRSNNKVSSELSGEAGFNLINANIYVDTPISDEASIQFSARGSLNGLWESPVYTQYSERIFQDSEITNTDASQSGLTVEAGETFSFYDFSTRVLWDPNRRDKFRLNFLSLNNTLEFNESIAETNRSQTSELDLKSYLVGLSWNRVWSESFQTNVMAYGTTYYLRALNKDLFTTQEVFQENDVLETGLKLNSTFSLSPTVTLSTGYQFTETGITNEQEVNLPRFLDFDKQVLRIHALFSGINYKSPSKETNINAGARINYYSKFDKILFEPRISFNQVVARNFAVEALGELKSQSTTQRIDFDSDFLGIEKRRWVLADEMNFPVITSEQASIGLIYDTNKWMITATGFAKNVSGITSSNQGFQNQFQFERTIGSYSAKGTEFVINKKHRDYSIWLSYSFLNNEYTFDELQPANFPHNLDITHTSTLAGSYNLGKVKIAAGFNYRTGKPYTAVNEEDSIISDGITDTIQYGIPNSENLPDYYRLDLSGEYLWHWSDSVSARINLALLNVLDTRNTLNIRYAIVERNSGELSLNEIRSFSVGITPNFAFQVEF